jgi:hypothetical protein
MKKGSNPFLGTWQITEMEVWDQDFVDLEVPGHFTFEKDEMGYFQFGLVQGELDCRVESGDREPRIEFSWEGQDETDPACGRGWAEIEKDELRGRIFIHMGEDSEFRARKARKGKSSKQ